MHVRPAVDQGGVFGPDGSLVERLRDVSPDLALAEIRRVMETVGATRSEPEVLTEARPTHDVIARQARARGVDLLVMGTHGAAGSTGCSLAR